MRYLQLIALPFALLFVSSSYGQLKLYEGFDYTVGDRIIGKVNTAATYTWNDPSSPAQPGPTAVMPSALIDPQIIVDENLSYAGLPASTGKSLTIPRGIPSAGPTTNTSTQSNLALITVAGPNNYQSTPPTVFFSMAVKMTSWFGVTDATAATQQIGGFVAGFAASASNGPMSAGSVYGGQLRFRRELDGSGVQTNKYQIGFNKNNQGTLTVVWDQTQAFGVGDTVFLVGEYLFGTNAVTDDTVKLWINPTPGAAEGTPNIVNSTGIDVSTSSGTVQAGINSFWLRSDTSTPGDYLVDEVRIGSTYASVTPPALLLGDFNSDSKVDAGDYATWRKNEVAQATLPNDGGATDQAARFTLWRANFGNPSGVGSGNRLVGENIPEPSAIVLLLVCLAALPLKRRGRIE